MTKKSTRVIAAGAALTMLLSGCGKDKSKEVSSETVKLQQEYDAYRSEAEAKISELEEALAKIQSEKASLESTKAALDEAKAESDGKEESKQEDEEVIKEYSIDNIRITEMDCNHEKEGLTPCYVMWYDSKDASFDLSTDLGVKLHSYQYLGLTPVISAIGEHSHEELDKDLEQESSVSLREYLTKLGLETLVMESYTQYDLDELPVKIITQQSFNEYGYPVVLSPKSEKSKEYSIDEIRVTPTECDCEVRDFEKVLCNYLWWKSDVGPYIITSGNHGAAISDDSMAYLEKKGSVSLREYLTSLGSDYESLIQETYTYDEVSDMLSQMYIVGYREYSRQLLEQDVVDAKITLTKHQ